MSSPPRGSADALGGTTSGPPVRPPMGEAAYQTLRDEIVEGTRPPGSALIQLQLAAELGISRTPLREALGRLTHEGLVVWEPGHGYVVKSLSPATVTEVHQVRERLETLALELACGRLSRVEAARVRLLIEQMREADPGDAQEQYQLNRQFHQAVVAPCDNAFLLSILDQLWDHPVSRRITRSYVHDPGNVDRMICEHEEILAASLAGDTEHLLSLSVAHMAEGYTEARVSAGLS